MTDYELMITIRRVPRIFVAHCLDFDVVSQGTSPLHALTMLLEAVAMVLEADTAAGLDPYRRRAPASFWEEARALVC